GECPLSDSHHESMRAGEGAFFLASSGAPSGAVNATHILSTDRVSGPLHLHAGYATIVTILPACLYPERRVQPKGNRGGTHESCSGGDASVVWFVCRNGSDGRALCVSRDRRCRVRGGHHQWWAHGHHRPQRTRPRFRRAH